MKTLSAVGIVRYILEQYMAGAFAGWKDAANRFAIISVWMDERVDENGRAAG